jgi:hypothetical protein
MGWMGGLGKGLGFQELAYRSKSVELDIIFDTVPTWLWLDQRDKNKTNSDISLDNSFRFPLLWGDYALVTPIPYLPIWDLTFSNNLFFPHFFFFGGVGGAKL